jgi:hypothetical protein
MPGTLEVETGSLQVRGQPGLHSEILSQKQKKQINKNLKKLFA